MSSSSSEEIILLTAAYILSKNEERRKKKKVNRRIWTKKWIEKRSNNFGALALIQNELRSDDKFAYRNYLRMNEECFNLLLQKIEQDITDRDTNFRSCISARDRLTITLRFLATGESYQSLSYYFRVGRSTLSKMIPEVVEAICNNLQDEYIRLPTSENEWSEKEKIFRENWNFPNCCGAMDGKHVTFRPSRSEGSFYRNYKGTDSIILLAIVDGDYNFLCIDVGVNGRASDGGVYRSSAIYNFINSNSLNIPNNVQLPGTDIKTPFVFVADDAFPLSTRIMKPFRYHGLSKEQNIYNYRVSRARRVVENAFGILSNRFRILLNPIILSVEKVEKITIACCILHNFLIQQRGLQYVDVEESRDLNLKKLDNPLYTGNKSTQTAVDLRTTFVQYFNGVGQVPWQDDYINSK